MPSIDLRQLILALTCASVLLTLTISMHSSMKVQRHMLITSTLESNRVYAAKLAAATDVFLETVQMRLRYAGSELAADWSQPARVADLVNRLQYDSNSFNTVLIADALGQVLAIEPDNPELEGKRLHSSANQDNLRLQVPLVSAPFIAASGRLVVTISEPIFDASQAYLGYIAATIALQESNILHTLLGEHHFQDGSYFYVVDQQGQLIYHQDKSRIGDVITGNPAIEALKEGQSGSMSLRNSLGVDVLAGYAPVASVHWGVVAQRPLTLTLAELKQLTWYTLWHTLPWLLLSLLFIGFLSRTISLPLSQLARRARHMDESGAKDSLESVRSWYFEAAQLKASLIAGLHEVHRKIGLLSRESHTDQLTGLANRREMTKVLTSWQSENREFAVILVDIDFFKKVNDRYGHDAGDRVLEELAELMRDNSRSDDLLCRTGGEEFAMFLPDTTPTGGYEVAERLRKSVERHRFFINDPLTVSCGVAHWPQTSSSLDVVMKSADMALYAAKEQGRNQVVPALFLAGEGA